MALQTIGLPQSYGQGLSQGIESLLTNLATSKIQQLQTQQQAKNLQSILGSIPPEKAHALAQLPDALQQLVLKDLLAQPSQEAYAQALGFGIPQNQPQQQQMGQPRISGIESLELLQGKIPQQFLQQQQQQFPQQEVSPQSLPRLNERQATEIAKIRREEQKQSYKEKQEAFKFNKEFIKDVTEKAKSARQAINDLDRMEELEQSGNLNGAGFEALLAKSGLDIPALKSPESQEFNKIAQNFLRNAKQYYGGRVSNFEVEQFLKTIPSLSQSPEGRKRVIANLKNISRAELAYNKAARDIINENKGVPPFDLAIQVDERVEKQSKKLAEQFKKDLEKQVAASESALTTVGGSIAGSALNLLGKAAPAIGGYLVGGPVGAAVGALGGVKSLLGKE